MMVLQYCVSIFSLPHLFGQRVRIVKHTDVWTYGGFEPKLDLISRIVYAFSTGISAVLCTVWSVFTIKKGHETISSSNFRRAQRVLSS
ncbi:hypothetical protein Aduo_004603 [Ancylostoma duodenale]